MMQKHDAWAQMMGYMYQIRYALFLLLDNENPNAKICIEKFDDISFVENGSPTKVVQTKQHLSTPGNLTDSSTDLWKTIQVWFDLLNEQPELINSCKFLIVTCSEAPDNSAASYLKSTNRDEEKAYSLLIAAASPLKNKKLKSVQEQFLKTGKEAIIDLLKNCEIIDKEPIITDLEDRILKYIRPSCDLGKEREALEQVEGWWLQRVIELLKPSDKHFIEYQTLIKKVKDIGNQHTSDYLPIDKWDLNESTDEQKDKEKKVFVQQLRLINASDNMISLAIKYFFLAGKQRNKWMTDQRVSPEELDDYDERLTDEWEEKRSYFDGDDPVSFGKSLYRALMDKEIRIRECCKAIFVMRGSYQILSNNKEIGWHMDFKDKLKEID